ncbi:hypothetical protein GLAREA_04521 [Glarea lozoyensis ATCC 20868]|uniref:Uncharacterized protein n=1 Tax=Glarea lozoyensis (strain ATCC 20868 / MF5171) TaxID=1116229 RepID=S3CPW6_GLAL2|nr:uncharacterized protein GLAREA_04521 [Glarea lozoyensis ATCC 20868]EPE27730.1 hypothetical protein GLAREA_04521 [Glarea lozoyensis ATCC 20868]
MPHWGMKVGLDGLGLARWFEAVTWEGGGGVEALGANLETLQAASGARETRRASMHREGQARGRRRWMMGELGWLLDGGDVNAFRHTKLHALCRPWKGWWTDWTCPGSSVGSKVAPAQTGHVRSRSRKGRHKTITE